MKSGPHYDQDEYLAPLVKVCTKELDYMHCLFVCLCCHPENNPILSLLCNAKQEINVAPVLPLSEDCGSVCAWKRCPLAKGNVKPESSHFFSNPTPGLLSPNQCLCSPLALEPIHLVSYAAAKSGRKHGATARINRNAKSLYFTNCNATLHNKKVGYVVSVLVIV